MQSKPELSDVDVPVYEYRYPKGTANSAVQKAKKEFADSNEIDFRDVIGKKLYRTGNSLFVLVADRRDMY